MDGAWMEQDLSALAEITFMFMSRRQLVLIAP
jgi:hypothetical protein